MTSPLAIPMAARGAPRREDESYRTVNQRTRERALVEGMVAGEEWAFEELAQTYVPALHRFAGYRLDGDRELTLDIVQSTIVKVIDRIETFRGECALMTWLCACCRMEIAAHFRRRGRRPRAVELDEDFPPAQIEAAPSAPDGPEHSVLRRETGELVHIALDLLPEHYAKALEWKYLEELPVKEIAGRLELSAKAAESLLTRARESFRDTYARLFAGPVSGAGGGV